MTDVLSLGRTLSSLPSLPGGPAAKSLLFPMGPCAQQTQYGGGFVSVMVEVVVFAAHILEVVFFCQSLR